MSFVSNEMMAMALNEIDMDSSKHGKDSVYCAFPDGTMRWVGCVSPTTGKGRWTGPRDMTRPISRANQRSYFGHVIKNGDGENNFEFLKPEHHNAYMMFYNPIRVTYANRALSAKSDRSVLRVVRDHTKKKIVNEGSYPIVTDGSAS
jgi:hypothetical protein